MHVRQPGRKTRWERDAQGRMTKEIRADGRQTLYAYENTTGRLKSVTDAKNQVTSYSFLDDRLASIACKRSTTSIRTARRSRSSMTRSTPSCDENCVKVMLIVSILGRIVWFRLTRTLALA